MRFLQCACIVGAVAALSPLIARGPSNVSEPARVDAPVVAETSLHADDAQASVAAPRGSSLPLASLEDAQANLIAAFAAFMLTSAYPMPMSSSDERTTPAADTPTARLRHTIVASAETLSEQFLNPTSLADVQPWAPPRLTTLVAADPLPVGSLPRRTLAYAAEADVTLDSTAYTSPPLEREGPVRLAYAAVPDGTLDPTPNRSPPLEREGLDLAYLADYVYSETPPPEKPAETVLRALKDVPEASPREEVRRAALIFGLDATFMEAVVKIESDFNPKDRTGSYIGLFQLSKYEFNRYGSGEITDARDNAIAGVYKFAVAAKIFELQTHEKATPAYLYLIHQQGTQGAAEHVGHPERLAWESMCATEEGKSKGERWCKRAIWQNTLPEVKKLWGSVEKLTSAGFVGMWRERVVTLYRRNSASASAAALQ